MTVRGPLVSLSALSKAVAPALEDMTLGRSSRGESGARRRIWEIIGASHCSIIGTCMTLGELRKIARRTGFPPDESRYGDYHIHGLFVEKMQDENPVSRAVQKHLDAKYEGAIRKAKGLEGESAFFSFWETNVDAGFVPGAYWALIGHPRLPASVEARIFGDVHMMSHICGASHRGAAREVAEARREKADAARRLAGVVAERNDEIARQRGEIERLQGLLRECAPLARECERLRREADELRRETARDDWAREIDRLRAENEALREERERLGRRCERLKARQPAPSAGRAVASAPIESRIEVAPPPAAAEEAGDLCGRRLLYVGGRPRTVCRMQQIVERRNGSLVHHDGGMEHSRAMLSDLVRRADAVFFPVDCVSHRAVGALKSLCESRGIPYCPLRSASAAAFERAIRDLGAPAASGPPPQGA